MKHLVALTVLLFAFSAQAAEPAKAAASAPQENTNCVKKDKAGKCPPLPKSEKPTPKKKAEAK